MSITWDEVRHRAIRFSRDWARAVSELGEKQTFWNEFFDVFGLKRRSVATFEEPVQSIRGTYGRIDLFWRGIVLVEHKSLGEDLSAAASQAFNYIGDLNTAGRGDEVPRYVIVSDFARFVLYDLEPDEQRELPLFRGIRFSQLEFGLQDLHRHIRSFAFIRGERTMRLDPEDPANQKAYDKMCRLHDELTKGGFAGSDLERLLVRILFCLFADDNGIFDPNDFQAFVVECTRADGADLGARLNQLFDILNTPPEKRSPNLGEELSSFPYVNGALFADRLGFPVFTGEMRKALVDCTQFQWARISPAVFGSLFQGIMLPAERRQQGGHYTGERDILKVVRSLFLDDLRAEFETIRKDASSRRNARLEEFRAKLRRLRFLDPACGCGNFLVLGYREIRQLELEALLEQHGKSQQVLDIRNLIAVDVDQFFGIELGEWPCRIAEVALWLMDHQMNVKAGEAFGQYFQRLPLRHAPHIVHGNALRLDWAAILPPSDSIIVMGNPPFVGKKARNAAQQEDMDLVFGKLKGAGILDYVACWYARAAAYIQGTSIKVGFVSTNSITQGEQPGVLWPYLYQRYGLHIIFGHRTFPWESEARGKAHVHVVIIGFSRVDCERKQIYDYEAGKEESLVLDVQSIGPYLVGGSLLVLQNRQKPVSPVPEIEFGSMPNDEGNLLLDDAEYRDLIRVEPAVKSMIRPLLSAHEYLHGLKRWCLWLEDVPPSDVRESPEVMRRLEAVRLYRENSARPATRLLAKNPGLFGEVRQPRTSYVLIPRHSSETRQYIPMSYFTSRYIVSDSCLFVPNATPFHFGVISSGMHMAWVRQICGRLESRYRYSGKLVYNNYPWPLEITQEQKERVEEAGKAVVTAREQHSESTLADLYDPLAMPSDLTKAHVSLDRAVDRCYRKEPFHGDRERVEFLFALYERLSMPLAPTEPAKRRGRRKST